MEYIYISEQGKTEAIRTMDKARSVIIATATVREHTREELLRDKDITGVAECFGINLNDLVIERSESPYDFYFTYSFR